MSKKLNLKDLGLDEISVLKQEMIKLKKENIKLKNSIKHYKYDDLTGLLLRKDFEDRIEELWYEYKEQNSQFIYCLVDINNLHKINRDLSMKYGDLYIVNTTQLLKKIFKDAMLFRIGGDEFAILKRGNSVKSIEKKLNKVANVEHSMISIHDGCGFDNIG